MPARDFRRITSQRSTEGVGYDAGVSRRCFWVEFRRQNSRFAKEEVGGTTFQHFIQRKCASARRGEGCVHGFKQALGSAPSAREVRIGSSDRSLQWTRSPRFHERIQRLYDRW
jgi:hypothetical protein